MSSMGNPALENWALEVWTVESGGGGGSSAGSAAPTPVPINSPKSEDINTKPGRHTSSQRPPVPKENPTSPLAASRSAVSAPLPKYDPSDSVQAVVVRCNTERRDLPPWSATSVPAHHSVFSQTVPPIPELIEVPLVIHRVGTQSTQSTRRADLDNQIATYLNIDEDTGFAPPYWQSYVGTVIVARKDRKPLLPQHLEAVWEYCNHILDLFGDGDGAPTWLYNRQSFEKWWKTLCEERQLLSRDDWANVKSPYET